MDRYWGENGNGSVVIIPIRFTALNLDSFRSNRISLERGAVPSSSFNYSISFDFLRTCRPCKVYWANDNNFSRTFCSITSQPADKVYCNFPGYIGHCLFIGSLWLRQWQWFRGWAGSDAVKAKGVVSSDMEIIILCAKGIEIGASSYSFFYNVWIFFGDCFTVLFVITLI